MKKSREKPQLRWKKSGRSAPGSSPGSFNIPEDALPSKMIVYGYHEEEFHEWTVDSAENLFTLISENEKLNFWIEIKGLGNKELFSKLAEGFRIHRLVLADVYNTNQRPKLEEHENHLFLISRMIYMNGHDTLYNEQMSLFLGKNFVITILENYEDVFDPIRKRMKKSPGHLRNSGSDFLAYALMDSILDHYFPVMEKIGERMDALEEVLMEGKEPADASHIIQKSKKDLLLLRRAIWPERDKINELIRGNSKFITEPTKLFLRDAYDHSIQIMDIVESYKEVTSGLVEIYKTAVSQRTNDVMKTLTIIATIFIPLNFIVGFYGMNFSRQNPDTGQKLPFNMPELYMPYGYLTVLSIISAVIILQLWLFYRKGWISKRKDF